MENFITYNRFQKEIEEILAGKLPEGCEISIRKVIKNNDLQLDSLVILSDQVHVSPNFYLQQFYERYLHGVTLEDLVSDILEMYENTRQIMGEYQMDLSLDACRDRIVYHLSSGEKNRMRLENVPFIPFLDMVITFHILMIEDEDGIGSVMVRDTLQQAWDIGTKQLFQLAEENTMRMYPLQIRSMEQVFSYMEEKHPELSEEYPVETMGQEGLQDILVVSNQRGINGAAVLLYPGCLEQLERQCEGNYYILPSSIHEVLVMPDRDDIPMDDLQSMVLEVNANCVKPDEILSDHVYHYSRERKMVEICQERESGT